MMAEGLLGPKRSKTDIDAFENWLQAHCKEKMSVAEILETWQYLTGHEPRKTTQYLKAIARASKIRLFRNNGVEYCLWTGEQQAAALETDAESELSDIIERRIIREKMIAGPCTRNCPLPKNTDCRRCIRFLSLKNKEFSKEHAGR
jgi:hypothetical protein